MPSIALFAGVVDRVGTGCDDFALLRLGTSETWPGRSGVGLGVGVQMGIEVGRTL